MQQTNATWSNVVVTNLEAIIAKNLSHNFQVVATLTRQWQHLDGTWNPTDPARFIQPDAFPNNRDLSRHLFGNGDDNSLDGGGAESGVAYRPYSVRMAGQYFAPWDIRVAASYVIQAGGYLGPVVIQNATGDPIFGPGPDPTGQRHDAGESARHLVAFRLRHALGRPASQRDDALSAAQSGADVQVRQTERRCRPRHLQRVQHRRAHAVEHRREPAE